MKKCSKWIILLVLFVLCPKNVDALSCTNAKKVNYQDMAKNIAYSYDAKDVTGTSVFTLTFSNVPKSLALRNARTGKWYFSKNNEIVITNLKANLSYRYDVFAVDGQGCDNIALYTLNIILPYFNKYYSDPLCSGIEEYELCQKWANIKYSYEDWKIKVKAYKDSLIPKEETLTPEEERMNLIERIVDIYGDIYYIIFPIIIVVGMTWIYLYNKKRELF